MKIIYFINQQTKDHSYLKRQFEHKIQQKMIMKSHTLIDQITKYSLQESNKNKAQNVELMSAISWMV